MFLYLLIDINKESQQFILHSSHCQQSSVHSTSHLRYQGGQYPSGAIDIMTQLDGSDQMACLQQMQESLYYEFEINIHRIYVDIGFPCNLQVKWRKGKHQSSGRFFKIPDSIHFLDVNDFIGIKVRCKVADNRFLPQDTKVQVLLFPLHSNEIKVAGEIQKFDLTQVIPFDRRRETTQRKFEMPLSKSTPNSRIVFTITAKYLMDGQNEESLADMSFQAQPSSPLAHSNNTNSTNFTNNVGANNSQASFYNNRSQENLYPPSNTPSFNQTTDMTFRPPTDKRNSRTKDQYSETKSPLPKVQSRPESREVKADTRETRIDSRDVRTMSRDSREGRQSTRMEPSRNQTKNQHPFARTELPLGFSFGPQIGVTDKDRQLKELMESFNEVNRELADRRRECERLQAALRQAEGERGGIDEKKLQLINELNSTITQLEAVRRDNGELQSALNKARDQTRQVNSNLTHYQEQINSQAQECMRWRRECEDWHTRCEKVSRQSEQMRQRYDKMSRENEQLRNQVFRKQSELISSENKAQQVKGQYISKSLPLIDQLKRVNQDLGRQRAELDRALTQANNIVKGERTGREEAERRAAGVADELEKEREKVRGLVAAFEAKERANRERLQAIEQEMEQLFREKEEQIRGKAEELRNKEHTGRAVQELNHRLAEESSAREEHALRLESLSKELEALQIQNSQLRVKIKHLEEACTNLERDLADKDKEIAEKSQFIDRVREYVAKIEGDNADKDSAIKERDEFIAKAKEFITAREKELLLEIDRLRKEGTPLANPHPRGQLQRLRSELQSARSDLSIARTQLQSMRADLLLSRGEIERMRTEGKRRQAFVGQLVAESNGLQSRAEQAEGQREEAERRCGQLQEYAGHLQERLEIAQEEMEELGRKTRSQEETLSELVKHKLDMEIQLSLARFELQSLKSRS